MAIDYGRKRTGIAVTDSLQIIASGLTTVATKDIYEFLADYFTKHQVDCVVVGEPFTLDNQPSDSTKYVQPFVNRFKKLYPNMKLERIDERFTSKMAFQSMIDVGMNKKHRRNKALVDEISATIILQSYMNQTQL
jgi:putative Holliday junction resolvase